MIRTLARHDRLELAISTQQQAANLADKDFHMLGIPHWLVMNFKLPARAPESKQTKKGLISLISPFANDF